MILIFGVIAFLTGIASAQAPPNFPIGLKGSVSIGGNPAPPGTQIFAKVGDTIVGSTVVQSEGIYGDKPYNLLPVSAGDGAQVDIYVNDMIITSFTYHLQDARAGITFQVDLIVPTRPTPVPPPYFKCYKIERQVNLRTQFGFEQGVDVQENGEFLCAPALLNDTGNASQQLFNMTILQSTYPHLKFYGIDAPAINVPVSLSSSLFGNETVNVTKPVFLGLPAEKRRKHVLIPIPPAARDLHYKCYIIEPNTSINKEVTLVTQFGEEQMIVTESRFLCAPALKNPPDNASQQNQTLEALEKKFPHLKLYRIEPPGKPFATNIPVDLTTQFGIELNVNITRPLYLAVPVTKEVCPPQTQTNIILNTGFYQASGTLIPFGIKDLDWYATSPPLISNFADVVTSPHMLWANPFPDSRWISYQPSAASIYPYRNYTYQYRNFTLPPCFSNANLSLSSRADDEGWVFLNGIFIGKMGPFMGPTNPPNQPIDLTTANQALFNPGLNSLTVVVRDGGHPVTGFVLNGTVTAN